MKVTCIVIKDVFILTISLLAFSWCSTFYYIILYIIYIYIFLNLQVYLIVFVYVCVQLDVLVDNWPLYHVDEAVRGEMYNFSLFSHP